MIRRFVTALLCCLSLVACAGPSSPGAGSSTSGAAPSTQSRAITIAYRYEVDYLAAKPVGPNSPVLTRRLFNASHALIDAAGTARPYLAESLPRLGSNDWQVFPDGRMITTYRLRPGLTWHDGKPITAEDFSFAWRVYVSPIVGIFIPKPQDIVEDILTPDTRTVVIHWKALYPDAGSLGDAQLDPLPRHILEQPFTAAESDAAAREAFLSNTFWTTDYVGAGPYRLDHWESGASMEASAFAGHALGRPKIDKVRVRFFADENTVLTNVLGGNLDLTMDFTLRFEHAQVLKRDWESASKGKILLWPASTTASVTQFRPEFQKSPPLLDVRVRRALAHGMDREAINDGVFGGDGLISETYVNSAMPYHAEVQRTISHYPYDPRRVEILMNEAGLAKDRDGFFAAPSGERFRPDFWVTAGSQFERHQAIMADTWRRAGIDAVPFVLSVVAGRDNETRATFPGLTQIGMASSEASGDNFISSQIGTAGNRWRGSNRGGWTNAEFDALWDSFNTALDRSERDQVTVRSAQVISEQLPAFVIYPNLGVRSVVRGLSGPEVGLPSTLPNWNIHEWEIR